MGLAEDEEDFDFEREFTRLKAELESQIKEERILSEKILNNLEIIGGEMIVNLKDSIVKIFYNLSIKSNGRK